MAYGLGQNIALLQTSLYLFNELLRPTSKRIKQKKLATYYYLLSHFIQIQFFKLGERTNWHSSVLATSFKVQGAGAPWNVNRPPNQQSTTVQKMKKT